MRTHMPMSAGAKSTAIGPDGLAGSGPKANGSGVKMSCADRGDSLYMYTYVAPHLMRTRMPMSAAAKSTVIGADGVAGSGPKVVDCVLCHRCCA